MDITELKSAKLEPGLMRVFRWYAWLRIVSLAIIPILYLRGRRFESYQIDSSLPLIVSVVDVLVLILYLYAPGLERRLGRYFFPLGILIASVTITVEQYVFINVDSGWQLYPFLFVLLILVAWQYRFRDVVIYTLGLAAFEIVLIFLFPPAQNLGGVIPVEFRYIISLGLLFSRVLIFLVLGYVVTTLMKDQRAQRRALADANQRLIQHAATLEQLTTSRERLRLSRELHDTLAHTLSALTVQVEALLTVWNPIPQKVRDMLDDILNTTRSGLDETRRALNSLRASPLEEMGLALAVRTLAEDTASRCGMILEMDILDHLDDLSMEVEQCYYRVAQEALANLSEHSAAETVKLTLKTSSKGLLMKIEDDGVGMDSSIISGQNGSKFGLRGMRERAELIGAHFDVDSQPGSGTKVKLFLEDAG
jgi:signal transduction histidine kinase